MITEELIHQLRDQLENPNFCHIRLGKSGLFTHGKNPKEPFPFEGKPVRFSRMAAERMVKMIPGAKIEEIWK